MYVNIIIDAKKICQNLSNLFILSPLYLRLVLRSSDLLRFYGLKFLRWGLFALEFSLMPAWGSILSLDSGQHYPSFIWEGQIKTQTHLAPPQLTLGPGLWCVERESAGEKTAGGVPRVPVEDYQQQGVHKGVNERNVKSYLAIKVPYQGVEMDKKLKERCHNFTSFVHVMVVQSH